MFTIAARAATERSRKMPIATRGSPRRAPTPHEPARRRALHLLGAGVGFAAGLSPRAALAQARPQRIGWLSGAQRDDSIERNLIQPFRDGLRSLGRVEGRDHVIEFRFTEGRTDRMAAMAAELLQWQPDLLIGTANQMVRALQQATGTVPILALAVDNPVELGFAQSLARPGGNITGISSWGIELVAKRLQLVKELLPPVKRLGVLGNSASVGNFEPQLRRLAEPIDLQAQLVLFGAPEQLADAFETLRKGSAEAVIVLADPLIWAHRVRIAELCAQYKLPSVWGGRDYLLGGGLASYQSDFPALFRRGAILADKILRGAKPADVPFERATKLQLVINLRAARTLGLTVPNALLVAADEIID
jgi:putative tryptophan/tyrosine transport system substrate-binding protein